MIKNKKGQALVEFILILPILLMLIFGLFDFGKIIYAKNELANIMPDIKEMYKENNSLDKMLELVRKNNKDNNLLITNEDNEYIKIKIYRNVELITPGLGLVIDNPFEASTELVVKNEK